MSFFSIGGGLGFALAPAVTLALVQARGTSGLLMLVYPTVLIAAPFLSRLGAAPPPSHQKVGGTHSPHGRDDWRGFGILSVATVLRSIVFYGLNTFLALYFMGRWGQSAAEASRASVVFLGTSLVGTLLGGWLADRFGRREVMRIGFTAGTVLLAIFLSTPDRTWAMALLVPLAVFLFLPTSGLVVLGQEYLPNRVGLASGVTLGLAVSVGGMCAPLLGRLGDAYGMNLVVAILLGLLLMAAAQTYALPPVGRHKPDRALDDLDELLPVTADR
jgi:FSR family fosmidomycin resistance protein-like MFS transporter